MSESELTRETLVENLNLVDCFWGEINFACTAKKLPSFKDRKTWTYQTDKMKIGKTVCGTIEGMEPIELTVVSSFKFVFQQLTAAATSGTTEREALRLSNEIAEMASDLATFTNAEGGIERTSRAITSALTGERKEAFDAFASSVADAGKAASETLADIAKEQSASDFNQALRAAKDDGTKIAALCRERIATR